MYLVHALLKVCNVCTHNDTKFVWFSPWCIVLSIGPTTNVRQFFTTVNTHMYKSWHTIHATCLRNRWQNSLGTFLALIVKTTRRHLDPRARKWRHNTDHVHSYLCRCGSGGQPRYVAPSHFLSLSCTFSHVAGFYTCLCNNWELCCC